MQQPKLFDVFTGGMRRFVMRAELDTIERVFRVRRTRDDGAFTVQLREATLGCAMIDVVPVPARFNAEPSFRHGDPQDAHAALLARRRS